MKPESHQHVVMTLPDSPLGLAHILRAEKALAYRFPLRSNTLFCTSDEYLSTARSALPSLNIQPLSNVCFEKYGVALIMLSDIGVGIGYDSIDFNKCRVYEADKWCMIRYCRKTLDEIEYPYVNAHIFNKISSKLGNERLSYFPGGMNSQYVGIGPLDEFGHRIPKRLFEYTNRPSNEIVIALFGGSAAWSTHSHFNEMFSAKLEDKLNAYLGKCKAAVRVSVLNLAQPSGLILNDLNRYIQFCHDLKPEVVLVHGGANDLSFGQMCDQYLLQHYSIAYQFQLEKWANVLVDSETCQDKASYSAEFEDQFHDALQQPVKTYPRQIVSAFYSRVQQFKRMVELEGRDFIFGLQPMLFSKKYKTSEEESRDILCRQASTGGMYRNSEHLFDILETKHPDMGCQHYINFHQNFKSLRNTDPLFCDGVHTSPEGDAIIADLYYDYIVTNLMKKYINTENEKRKEPANTCI